MMGKIMDKALAKNITILFVDDEMDFRNALAFSFERKGYNVLTAANGKDAFEIIRTQPVNVVVSDILMPNGGGIELLDQTKDQHPETPIILLVTGYSEVTTEEAHHKGAEALFSKPLDLNILEDTIVRLLTPREQRWAQEPTGVDSEIEVELRFQSLNTAIEAKAVSLGRGGMFILLNQEEYPNINDEVSFKIIFKSSGKSMNGNGIVRWIRTHSVENLMSGFGVEFTYLEEKARSQILEYVNSKKLKTFIPKY